MRRRWGRSIRTPRGALNNLASLFEQQGRYAEAEPLYRRALEISAGAGDGPFARGEEPGQPCRMLEDRDDSRGRAALPPRSGDPEEALGPEHPDTATSLNNLAEVLREQGRYAEAEPLYRRAITIFEKALGPEHPDTTSSLNNLALLLKQEGRYVEAEPLYRRALAIREKALRGRSIRTPRRVTKISASWSRSKVRRAVPWLTFALPARPGRA